MACTMAVRAAVPTSTAAAGAKALRAAPLRARAASRAALQVRSAVQYDYDIKVFPKELVQ